MKPTRMANRYAPHSGSLFRWMIGIFIVLLIGGATAAWFITSPHPAFPQSAAAMLEQGGDKSRGKLIFEAANCASCHLSPGQSDRKRLGGGLALASPFGTFYPPNISSDPDDGIGQWRTIDLANALISGISPKGAHYYPAFPYTTFTHMRVEDAQDLMAYLRTLPPVQGHAPPHELVFPFTIRRMVGFWKFLYFDRSKIKPDPHYDAEWNHGRYLVEALSHCAECHSPHTAFGAVKNSSRYAGGQEQEGIGYAPNITPVGIGHWSSDDIVDALTDGHTPELRQLGSSMADVVTNMAALPLSDRKAIAAYIISLPPRQSSEAVKER